MGEEKYLGGKGYQWYKHYARFMNRHLMYRVEYIGKENLPALGEPCMIVSNHQNCANDPLNLLLGLENESHPYVIARGKVFSWHKLITKFFLWLGMLPAFRLDFEGQESLSKNAETIRISGGKMLEGNRLIMYPEGTHQDKHWLGDFSFGYTRLAFETAARDGFAHNIKIVPSAHHYADYFEPGVDVVIRFGQPISLSDYYELYKTKPRTAQRQVNEVVGMPFFFILTVLVCGLAWGLWWQSALWMLLAVWPLSEFALREWKWMKATWRNVRLLKVESGKRKVESLMMKRKQLFEKLKDII